jgi:SET domain-containing protein
MTLPYIQSQMTSNQSDSLTQMEACATTQYWRPHSDTEDESVPEDTFLTRPYLS